MARPAAGERNEAVGLALEPGELDMRRLVRRAFEEGAGVEPHQAAVAGLARGQEHDALARRCRGDATMAAGVVLVAEIDRERAADDRLHAIAGELLREFERTEHVVGVGQRQRRLVVGLGEFR